MPRIAIITPSFNQGQFIERTIQSVLSQPCQDREYVVVDGGSTDSTVSILKKYDDAIRWVSERDRGQTHAVNKGLKMTSAPIIGWLNSDDIYYPGAIDLVLQTFDQYPDIDVVYGNANHIDTEDGIIEPYPTEPFDPLRLRDVCYLCQPAVFFRRRVIEQYGELDERLNYCMDYEFWLRLATHQVRFLPVPQILAGSRLHNDTKTLGATVKVHQEINDMMKKTYRRVPDRWLCNYAHVIVNASNKHYTPRQRKRQIAWQSLLASWRWNKGISLALARTTLRWLATSYIATEAHA